MTARSGLPVRRVEADPERLGRLGLGAGVWPLTVPAVQSLVATGLDLGPATVLVGENGSGKSTLVEAIAEAFGLNPEGGSPHARHSTRASESPLGQALRVVRSPGGARWGYFLRAEAMHGLYTYLEDLGSGPSLHELSHGESFREVLEQRFGEPGFYVLDEPESALSFDGCLVLLTRLLDLIRIGAQVLVATHSPVVAALPGARLLELGDDGLVETRWEDLDLVRHQRLFLDDPQRYLRHLT